MKTEDRDWQTAQPTESPWQQRGGHKGAADVFPRCARGRLRLMSDILSESSWTVRPRRLTSDLSRPREIGVHFIASSP